MTASPEVRLARLYRMLFEYETADNGFVPAFLSTMGHEDCRRGIALLEKQIAKMNASAYSGERASRL